MTLSPRIAARVLREVLAPDIASGAVLCLRAVATDGALIGLDYGGTVRAISKIVVTFPGGTQPNGIDAIFPAHEIGTSRVRDLRALVFSRSGVSNAS